MAVSKKEVCKNKSGHKTTRSTITALSMTSNTEVENKML